MIPLHLYSRPGCHLCDDFEEGLRAHWGAQIAVQWRDVDRDPDWRRRFGTRIPVLTDPQGRVLCAGTLDVAGLTEMLGPPV